MSRVGDGLGFHIMVWCVCLECLLCFLLRELLGPENSLRCLLGLSSNTETERSCPMIDGFVWDSLHTSNTTLVAR